MGVRDDGGGGGSSSTLLLLLLLVIAAEKGGGGGGSTGTVRVCGVHPWEGAHKAMQAVRIPALTAASTPASALPLCTALPLSASRVAALRPPSARAHSPSDTLLLPPLKSRVQRGERRAWRREDVRVARQASMKWGEWKNGAAVARVVEEGGL